MIKLILIVVIVAAFLFIFGATIGALLGILDLSILTTFTSIVGTVISTITTQYDLLLVSFPLTLNLILILMMLGIIRLVVSNFEKK
jgi:hypothetical protein